MIGDKWPKVVIGDKWPKVVKLLKRQARLFCLRLLKTIVTLADNLSA